MKRNFQKLSIEEFKALVEEKELLDDYHINLTDKMSKDLSKVEFADENEEYKYEEGRFDEYKDVIGYHTLDNGLTFLGVISSGDWEVPMVYIIYYDGKDFRCYIPSEGNCWNKTYKKAFGNDETEDHIDLMKFVEKEKIQLPVFDKPYMPIDCTDINYDKYYFLDAENGYIKDQLVNSKKIIEDIITRFS